MFPLLDLHPQKVRDPIIAEWILDRIRERKEHIPAETSELEKLFDNDILREFITGDSFVLPELLSNLPPAKFANFIDEICRLWPQWTDRTAHSAAIILANIAPEKFLQITNRFIQTTEGFQDWDKAIGVMMGLHQLESPQAAEEAERLINALFPPDSEEDLTILYPWLMKLAVKFDLTIKSDIFYELLEILLEEDDEDNTWLDRIYGSIADEHTYLYLVIYLRDKAFKLDFTDLSFLFNEETPLPELNQLVFKSRNNLYANVQKYLPPRTSENANIYDLLLLAVYFASLQSEQECADLDCLILGLFIKLFLKKEVDYEKMSLTELTQVISTNTDVLPEYENIARCFTKFPEAQVEEILIKSVKRPDVYQSKLHIVKIMGLLAYPAFIDPLFDCLTEKNDDFIQEEASESLCKFGALAEARIIDKWDTMDNSQKIFSYGVLEIVGGQLAIEHLKRMGMNGTPGWEEMWCNTALNLPDHSFIKIIEPELKRKQPFIDETYLSLCLLLDYSPDNLNEIRDRVEASRQRSDRILKAMSGFKPEDIMTDSMILPMTCEACGKENRYEVKNVFIDPSQKKSVPFVGDDLACLSCGVQDKLSMSSMGYLSLSSEIMKKTMIEDSGLEYEGPLKIFAVSILKGKPTSLPEALNYYRKEIAHNPSEVKLLLGYANILIKIGRTEQAKTYYQKCLDLDDNCVEAALTLAEIYLQEDQPEDAYTVMHSMMLNHRNWQFFKLDYNSFAEFESAFFAKYETVRKLVKRPAIPMNIYFSDSLKNIPAVSKIKVGRNEPCPCGSGKKYKKCCGK